jgi:hypothetical protein
MRGTAESRGGLGWMGLAVGVLAARRRAGRGKKGVVR